MLLRLSRPSSVVLEKLVERARRTDLTYSEVGATAGESLPAGYRHDLYEKSLGNSPGAFERGVSALRRWQAHIGAGLEIVPPGAPVAENESVLLMLKVGGLWTAAPCRIVYVVDDQQQFGFAYGTLPGHPEIGEAAFSIRRGEAGDAVFRIRSFSRPADPLARIAAPISRRIQTAVTRRYLDALARAALNIQSGHGTPT
jgi:uncharacterized protein (UPF0548 family)